MYLNNPHFTPFSNFLRIAKRDMSVSTFFAVHNGLGIELIYGLGNEEQRARLLPDAIALRKLCAFALTEPLSFAFKWQ